MIWHDPVVAGKLYRTSDLVDAEAALQFISADCDRDGWAQIGMALKNAHGEAAFNVFDTWSRTSPKYNERDCRSTWRSISANGATTIATLFGHAKDGGYKPRSNGTGTPYKAPARPPVSVIEESNPKSRE